MRLATNPITTDTRAFDVLETISSIDLTPVEAIKEKINLILEEDKKLEIPVFLFIKDGIVEKIAHFMATKLGRSVSIGIAGQTASGKSTVAIDIIESLIEFGKIHNIKNIVTRVNTDDYYYDRSEMVKAAGSFAEFAKNYDLDCPEAFELDLLKNHLESLVRGEEVWLPKYDMSGTAKRHDNHTFVSPSKLVITEGMYALNSKINKAFDFRIFVDVSEQEQKKRWYRRAKERNLTNADEVYLNAVNKAEIHVNPTKALANIILNGEASMKDYNLTVHKFLKIAKEYKLNKTLIAI
jgi:uridine kinase